MKTIITDLISFARWEVGLCILIRLALSDRHRKRVYARDFIYLIELNTLVRVMKDAPWRNILILCIMLIRKPLFFLCLIVQIRFLGKF